MRMRRFPMRSATETEDPWPPELPAGYPVVQNGSDNGRGGRVFAVQRDAGGESAQALGGGADEQRWPRRGQ